ncbi:MAG TPA: redoxin domain-containing protein [Cyclobacteriaceae bacterium]|nr:redoxin domain-containing protein [Cyclobacteriaceae bacterium]
MKSFVFSFVLISSSAFAQTIQNVTLTNAVDGKEVSLASYASSPAVVIIFISHACPYDGYYLDRIKTLANQYTSKVPVLLINSGTEDTESIGQMKTYADECKLPVPYLADKEHTLLSILNPRKSPEGFLLQKSGNEYKVVYRGAIDDNAQSEKEVKNSYLKDAIAKLLAGQKIEVADVRPVGCSIKK